MFINKAHSMLSVLPDEQVLSEAQLDAISGGIDVFFTPPTGVLTTDPHTGDTLPLGSPTIVLPQENYKKNNFNTDGRATL